MLLAYLDESGTHGGSPNKVMAGFAGTQEQWDGFIPEWLSVLQKYGRRNLHMKRLKFSSPKEQEMLAELGALPLKHKLLMLATYVETDAYNRIVKGKVKPEFSKPYMIVFQKCLYGAAKMAAVKKDSVVLNFERTREYARSVRRMREIAQELRREIFTDIRSSARTRIPHSRLPTTSLSRRITGCSTENPSSLSGESQSWVTETPSQNPQHPSGSRRWSSTSARTAAGLTKKALAQPYAPLPSPRMLRRQQSPIPPSARKSIRRPQRNPVEFLEPPGILKNKRYKQGTANTMGSRNVQGLLSPCAWPQAGTGLKLKISARADPQQCDGLRERLGKNNESARK